VNAHASTVDVIFVPLDGSEFSARAVPVAVRYAALLDATVHLLTVVAEPSSLAEESRLLDKVDVRFEHVDRSVVVGSDVAAAIVNKVEQYQGAACCMASHGRGRSAALVGSVAMRAVALGLDPILVGPRVQPEAFAAGVVACVDETDESRALVPIAVRWADGLHTYAMAITVAQPVPDPITPGPPHRRFGPDEDVDGYLRRVVAPLKAQGVDVQTRAIYDPISPADGVHAFLRDNPAQLVIVASRATLGLKRAVFGSTAAGIVSRSPAPVLVIPRFMLAAAQDREDPT
jgi:nucleotide-binding universal stress UspA family protein